MKSWEKIELGKIAQVKGGKRLPKGFALQEENNGAPYLRIVDWAENHIDISNLMFVPEEAQAKIAAYTVQSNDIFISIVGTIGRIALIPPVLEGAFLTENAAKISVTSKCMNPVFLSLVLSSPEGQNEVRRLAVGSTQAKLALHRIKEITVPLPPLKIQNDIAEVLGALDDKITANNTLSQNLKELAQAEFTQLIKTAETVGNLRDVLHLEYGKSLPAKNRIDGEVEVFGSGGKVGTHNESLSSGPGVIVGRKGTAGAVYWAPNAYFPIDTTFYVVPTDQDFSLIFCFHLLKSLNLNDMNSDSAVPGLNREEALSSPIKIPTRGELKNFSTRADFLFTVAQQLNLESQALNSMRDTLLPQLMSGKIRVREAESIVEGVL